MRSRVGPYEAIDAKLRHLRQLMLECESPTKMAELVAERDRLLERRLEVELVWKVRS